MALYHCKQCGRVYPTMVSACICGNNDPLLWDTLSEQGVPQPQNTEWQQPQQPAPQQPFYGQNGYQPPVQPQNNGGGKSKKTVLIAVIAAVALIGLAVGGYFAYQHFWGDGATSSQNNGNKDSNDPKDKETTQAPAPAISGTTLTKNGVSITVPASFTQDGNIYINERDGENFSLSSGYADLSGYATITEYIQNIPNNGEQITIQREYTINGHRALSYRVTNIDYGDGADGVIVEVGDIIVMAEYVYDDMNNIPNAAEIQASLNSITVAD